MRSYIWFLIFFGFCIAFLLLLKFFGKNFSGIRSMIFPATMMAMGATLLFWVIFYAFDSTFTQLRQHRQRAELFLEEYLKPLREEAQCQPFENVLGTLHLKGEWEGRAFTLDFIAHIPDSRRVNKEFAVTLATVHIDKMSPIKLDLNAAQAESKYYFPEHRLHIQQSKSQIYSVAYLVIFRKEEQKIPPDKFKEWLKMLIQTAQKTN